MNKHNEITAQYLYIQEQINWWNLKLRELQAKCPHTEYITMRGTKECATCRKIFK